MQQEWLEAAQGMFRAPDSREMNPLQMAYIGDTVHDLFVRSMLISRRTSVGAMHKQAIRMVSAHAQAKMLCAIEAELTPEEEAVVRRGCNAHAKHAAPKNADPVDYARATGLEALWGYLYVTGQTQRFCALFAKAVAGTEDIWRRQS